jgi:hypothetical protein
VTCRRRFNERSGTPLNDLSVPTDIASLVVLWRLRYPLSLRHLSEMFLERVLARLFPWAPAAGDAWQALRWANGRAPLLDAAP